MYRSIRTGNDFIAYFSPTFPFITEDVFVCLLFTLVGKLAYLFQSKSYDNHPNILKRKFEPKLHNQQHKCVHFCSCGIMVVPVAFEILIDMYCIIYASILLIKRCKGAKPTPKPSLKRLTHKVENSPSLTSLELQESQQMLNSRHAYFCYHLCASAPGQYA